MYKYKVMQRFGDMPRQVGVVTAPLYTAASRKAQTLYNRHVWVERA